MAQKINPINNKLNIIKLNHYEFNKYGYSFNNYIKHIHSRNYVFNFINRFCLKYNLFLETINIVQTSSRILIFIDILNLKNTTNFKIRRFFLETISIWLKFPILFYFYKNIKFGNSSLLIVNYINHLKKKKANSPKKILQLIYNILKKQSKITKVTYTIQGIKLINLRGFKLEISGCFDSTRSQMAKKLKCNFGRVPLTKLKGYTDYSSYTFFTKSGSHGLKVWLFYEFKLCN